MVVRGIFEFTICFPALTNDFSWIAIDIFSDNSRLGTLQKMEKRNKLKTIKSIINGY